MTSELVDWLNRLALVLGMLSFWFVAPELLGEARIRALEKSALRILPVIPWVVVLAISIGVLILDIGFICNAMGILGMECPIDIEPLEPIVNWATSDYIRAIIVPLLPLLIGVFTPWLLQWLRMLTAKLLPVLIENEDVRQRSLWVGAFLFMFSFVLQMIATF